MPCKMQFAGREGIVHVYHDRIRFQRRNGYHH